MLAFTFVLSGTAGAQVSSQTLPAGFLSTGGNGGTALPQNSTADQKWQWHYDSGEFVAAGPICITQIWVRSFGPPVAAFDFPNFTVTLATATTDYQVGSHDSVFANNLSADTIVVRSGPWTGSDPIGGAWIPFGLVVPFDYDPSQGDFIIQIEKCGTNAIWGTAMEGQGGSAGTVGGNRYGNLLSCSATSDNFNNNEFVPIVRIDYIPGGPGTCGTLGVPGVNDLVINGQGSGLPSCIPVPVVVGSVLTLDGSGLPGSPITVSTAANCQVGALPIGSTYALDLELATHAFFLDGTGAFTPPTPLTPFLRTNAVGDYTFSTTAAVPVGTSLGLQMGFFNPSYPLGLATSQAYDVMIVSATTTTTYTLPDDGFMSHTLTVPVSYYGSSYNNLNICSNGYVTFNTGSGDFTETEAEFFDGWNTPPNPGVALYYSDLNRGAAASGATYVVSENLLTNNVKVEFVNQNHWSSQEPAGNFSVEFGSAGSGSVELDYAGFIPATTATDDGIIGVTDGDASVGTDTSFTASGGYIGNIPYTSALGPDSICETINADALIPFVTLTFTQLGVGFWTVN